MTTQQLFGCENYVNCVFMGNPMSGWYYYPLMVFCAVIITGVILVILTLIKNVFKQSDSDGP